MFSGHRLFEPMYFPESLNSSRSSELEIHPKDSPLPFRRTPLKKIEP